MRKEGEEWKKVLEEEKREEVEMMEIWEEETLEAMEMVSSRLNRW